MKEVICGKNYHLNPFSPNYFMLKEGERYYLLPKYSISNQNKIAIYNIDKKFISYINDDLSQIFLSIVEWREIQLDKIIS